MRIETREIIGKKINWILRCAEVKDALELSNLRVKIDSETENLAREVGEAVMDEGAFADLITNDLVSEGNLFIVSEVEGLIVGFARCIRLELKRFSHQADFGICILQAYCGFGIGNQLLKSTIEWADHNNIEKISLNVMEDNEGAINLYKRHGFHQEGLLIKDRKHKDGNYHNTVLMGRFHSS